MLLLLLIFYLVSGQLSASDCASSDYESPWNGAKGSKSKGNNYLY